jgi:light-regulated signal transduction histidine kinase (bacteriophytochrome)
LFSSLPLDLFFESPIDLNNEPIFIESFSGNDTERLVNEWNACLHLKEKESRDFSFIADNANENSFVYNFNVLGISLPSLTHASLLLFCVKKIPVNNIGPLKDKSASNYQKDYAEFIELAAHDLDAPLRKLSVLIDRMVMRIDPVTDIGDYNTRIQACLSDMRSMIDSLSVLAGFSSMVTKNDTCEIEKIITKTTNDLQKQEQNKITITSSSLPVLQGDSEQYELLFKNLLANAIRFRKKDILPMIEIRSESLSTEEIKRFNLGEHKVYFRITIKDNGIGFRQDYSDIIFNPFVRLNGKSEYPGNGIGLSICKKIVENHHGIIYAEGDENSGARFVLILPQAN